MTIASFTPRALSESVITMGGDARENFLSQNLFTRRTSHPTKEISYGVLNGNAKLLFYARPGEPAIPVDFNAGALKSFAPPAIRAKKSLDENKAETLNPGMASYIGPFMSPNAQIADKIALEQMDLRRKVDRTIEIQAAGVLATGTATFNYQDGTSATLTYGYTGDGTTAGDALTIQPVLSGTDAWSSASSKPLDALDELSRQIRENSDWSGPVKVYMGYEAWRWFRNNTQVKALLDNRNINVGAMTIAEAQRFKGYFGGYPIFEYAIGYDHAATGAYTAGWNSKSIAMVPDGSDLFTVEFAAIFDYLDMNSAVPQFIQTEYFSKMVQHKDPAVLDLVVETKPLCLIKDVSAIRIQQVIPD